MGWNEGDSGGNVFEMADLGQKPHKSKVSDDKQVNLKQLSTKTNYVDSLTELQN